MSERGREQERDGARGGETAERSSSPPFSRKRIQSGTTFFRTVVALPRRWFGVEYLGPFLTRSNDHTIFFVCHSFPFEF